MTQEQELLLKDLCSRLPYGVKAQYYGEEEECECVDMIDGIYPFDNEVSIGQYALKVETIKLYLFPLSSMTEEQRKEWQSLMIQDFFGVLYWTMESYDYLHKNHFDYRGLIKKGLAIDVSNLNIY